MAKQAVLMVHGVCSDGEWFEGVADALEPHFKCVPVSYPYFRRFGRLKLLLFPWGLLALAGLAACKLLLRLPAELESFLWLVFAGVLLITIGEPFLRRNRALDKVTRDIGGYDACHVVAHSFGTYLIGLALRKFPHTSFERLVLFGSVLSESYAWSDLHEDAFQMVRNDVGGRDLAVALAGWICYLVPGLGAAGRRGFKVSEFVHNASSPSRRCRDCQIGRHVKVHNVFYPLFGHPDAVKHAKPFWLPYFWDFEPWEFRTFLRICSKLARLEEQKRWSELEREEKSFRQELWSWFRPMALESYVEDNVRSWYSWHREVADGKRIEETTDLAVRQIWRTVADADAEYDQPRADRRESVIRSLHPRIAVGKAVETVVED